MQSNTDQAFSRTDSWAVTHPVSASDKSAVTEMRKISEPSKGKLRGINARVPFDAIIGRVAAPEGVSFRQDTVGGVSGWWCEPSNARLHAVILHAHGGWFNWGSALAYRHLVGHIAKSANTNAFVPDYRLAPEHPFPAALNDIEACYSGLVDRGGKSIALTGDSVGGNLILSALARIVAKPNVKNQVIAMVALSPVTDLAMTGKSWQSRANADPYFVRDQAKELIQSYLTGHTATDPAASPLYGNFKGLPPIRVQVGEDEVLFDDSWRYIERAVAVGVDAKIDIWEGMPHGFLIGVGRLDAASEALDAIGSFLSKQFSTSPPV